MTVKIELTDEEQELLFLLYFRCPEFFPPIDDATSILSRIIGKINAAAKEQDGEDKQLKF